MHTLSKGGACSTSGRKIANIWFIAPKGRNVINPVQTAQGGAARGVIPL